MAENNAGTNTTNRRNRRPRTSSKTVRTVDHPRNKHHRKPRSSGGTNHNNNISSVRVVDHIAFHRLFASGLPNVIASIINEIWIDPEYELIVRKRRPEPSTKRPKKRRARPKK